MSARTVSAIERRAEQADHDLRDVPLRGFMEQQALAWEFVAHPLMPRRLVTLLGAHGGAGKSMLILTMLAHAACGRSWAGIEIETCRCLYVSLEDPGDLVLYRLRRICEAYGLDPDAVEANLRVLDVAEGDSTLATEVNEQGVRRLGITPRWMELEALAAEVDWIAIDNASEAFDGNENERRLVRAFLRKLAELAARQNAALTLLAHIDKHAARNGGGGNSYSGSTAWHNSVRSRLALTPQEDGSVTLVQEKLNLGRRIDAITLRWNDQGVLMPAPPGQGLDPASITQQREDQEAALRALQMAAAVGLTVPAATSGPSTAWHALQPLPRCPEAFQGKGNQKRLHSALLDLANQGLIERQQFWANRNKRERWVLTTAGENFVSSLRSLNTPIPPCDQRTTGGVVGRRSGDRTNDSRTNESMAASAYRAGRDGDM